MHNCRARPKGLLNKSRMSVETFPGGTAHYHHHFGTGPHSSKSTVSKDGAFISSKTLLLLCCHSGGSCLLPKGKERSFCTPWIDIKEPTKSRLAGRQRWAVITAERREEREESSQELSILTGRNPLNAVSVLHRWVWGTVWAFRCTTRKHFLGGLGLWIFGFLKTWLDLASSAETQCSWR